MPTEKMERPLVRRLFAVLSHKDKWLMGRRPKEGLFGGLWEFVGFDAPLGEEPVPFLEKKVARETGISVRVKEALTAFEHQLTHRIYTVRPFRVEPQKKGSRVSLKKGGEEYEKFKWISPVMVNKFGISSITKRILAELKKGL